MSRRGVSAHGRVGLADTPTRRHADTPTRRHADTLGLQPSLGA